MHFGRHFSKQTSCCQAQIQIVEAWTDLPKDWPKDQPKDRPKDGPKERPKDGPKEWSKDEPKDQTIDWPKNQLNKQLNELPNELKTVDS